MKRVYWAVALAAAVCLSAQARADVKPFTLFSDGMVLQSGVKCPVWGTADPGEEVSAAINIGAANLPAGPSVKADKDGKWALQFSPIQPGGPYTVTIKGKNEITIKDVLVGEVWVASGQSNMEMNLASCADAKEEIAKSKNPKMHLFTVPKKIADEPTTELQGKWVECDPETSGSFSAVAYYFGRDLQKARNVPVGMIHTSWGGTPAEAWTPQGTLEANPDLKTLFHPKDELEARYKTAEEKHRADLAKWEEAAKQAKADGKDAPPKPRGPTDPAQDPHRGAVLYNGMINPLLPYAVKGAIWYQGESNAGAAYQYRTLFPTMIESWRAAWKNPDMPFLFVQLAPFTAIVKEPQESAWAELREAQLMTSEKLKNTGMAVITDVGEEKDIHPKHKEPVGARLAVAALGVAYGEKIVYSGPIYDKMAVDGKDATLSFRSIGQGLDAKNGALTGFTIAGDDKKFHDATAEIKGDRVVVHCDQVEKPIAVRFGWANFPVVNLWNKDGLPASPFRTDDFPGVTQPKTSVRTSAK
jgi:sialate O-acetylesterase